MSKIVEMVSREQKREETYHRLGCARRFEPGTLFRESWGYAVIVECRAREGAADGRVTLYDMTLRRLSREEETAAEVLVK